MLCPPQKEGDALKLPDCVSVLDVTQNEKMQMMREVLEEQFGKVQSEGNTPIWRVVLPTDVQFEVDTNTWEVRCQDDVLAAAVAETIEMVNQIVFSVCLKFQNSGRFLHITHLLLFNSGTADRMEPVASSSAIQASEGEAKKEKGVSKATAQKLLAKYKQLQVRSRDPVFCRVNMNL